MMAKNKIKSGRDMVILTTLVMAITASILLIIFPPFTLTGAFGAGGSNWENKIDVSATSDQQSITKHIVFGENKPITCANGIYIEASSKEVPFKTTNEVYDEHSGVCSETDVVFDNLLYQAPAPPPAPPENGGPAPNFGLSETQTITYDIYYGKISATEVMPQPEQALEQQPSFEIQATNITGCSNLSSAGTYLLNTSISDSNLDTCMKINASGITLDCQNHTIDGDDTGSYGVNVIQEGGGAVTGITVRNCLITDWVRGANFGVKTATLQNSNFTNNTYGVSFGVDLIGLSTYTISSNRIWDNDYGLYGDGSAGILDGTISNNNVSNNLQGVYGSEVTANFAGNTINNNDNYNVELFSTGGNTISSNTFNSATSGDGVGLLISGDHVTVYNNTANSNAYYGIWLVGASNISLNNNTARSNAYYGIFLNASSNSNLTNNNLSSNSVWDFYSLDSSGIRGINNTFSSYPTNASFTYSGNISLKGVTSPPSDPYKYRNIGKYINATNQSANAWLFLNISYNTTDLGDIIESSLFMARHNSTWETNTSAFASTYNVDTTADYVYANITNFGSIFAPLGASCFNITSSGVTTLTANLIGNQSSGRCMDIQVANAVLDCNGSSITGRYGDTTYGIYTNSTNTTIQNCSVLNYTVGIYLNSNYNSHIIGNTAENNTAAGIYLSGGTNNTVENNNLSSNDHGIYIMGETESKFTHNVANSNKYYGFALDTANNNTLVNNTFNSNSWYGVYIVTAHNNTLINNTASNNTLWDIYSWASQNSTLVNQTVSSYPTTFSATYIGEISIKGVTSPPSDPLGSYHNISKYINATDQTGGNWLFLNISYNSTDIAGLDETSLLMARHNSTWETNTSAFASPYNVDTTADYVYANITNFGSTFAPLGSPPTAVACNLTILVNGIEVSNFTNAAEPVNVTVNVTDSSSGLPVNLANIEAHEYNGYTFFIMPQFQDSNISNDVYAKVKTDIYGLASMTLVPTGARYVNTSFVGDYNITFIAGLRCNNSANKTLYVINTDFPTPSSSVSIPNRGQIDSFKTETLRIYDRVKGWLALGGGEHKDVTMTAGTTGTELFQAIAGKPYAVNLSVTGGSGENFKINVTETNGYPPFALPQSADSNVSNIAAAYFSDVGYDTEIHFTMIPTGGRYFSGSEAYAIKIKVYNSTGLIASGYVNVTDRSFPQPSGVQQGLFSQGNIDSFKTEILRIYDRIKGWLSL